MAQHDFVIANQGFPAFRTDLNNFLQAVGTTHSGTALPSGASAGLIWLDTTSAGVPLLKYYDGTDNITLATINHSANTVTFSGVSTDLVNDTTPQLGGDLDVQTNKVVTTANRNVKVYPNGTGVFEVGGSTNSGRIQLNCEQNTHGIKLASPPHSAAQSYTLTFPSTAPVAGKVLQTDGSGNLSFESASGGIAFQSVVKTSGFTAVAGEGYFCNTTSSAFTVTLPASPSAGNQVALVDYAGTFATNNITLGANSNKIEGGTGNKVLSTNREAVTLTYVDSTQGWVSSSGANEGTQSIDPLPYSLDFLVVAGGGGGGIGYYGGGAGAGGFRTSTQSIGAGTVITVTVGDGGAGSSSQTSTGTSGSTSSISGSGLTTISSAGGGGGGSRNNGSAGGASNGVSGGSGGGSAMTDSTGGSGNTPSTSPSQGNNGGSTSSTQYGASGGGAGAVGNVGSAAPHGAIGGAGSASSITGSSVTYAGGGAGGSNGPARAGGSGGGGSASGSTGGNGTANSGGGGAGGGLDGFAGGSGGKGVVIISVPTASYSSTTTGSPTVTTYGSNTIMQFNGSGSYTS